MSRLSRDSWLAILLLFLFIAVTAIAIYQEMAQSAGAPPLSSHSTQPDGAQALWRYLDKIGLEPKNPRQEAFSVSSEYDLFLMLAPQTTVTPTEWRVIDGWIENGGTLLITGDDFFTNQTLDHFGFRLGYTGEDDTPVLQAQPMMISPELPADAQLTTAYGLQSSRDDYIVHFATEAGHPVTVSWPQGEGRVIVTSNPIPFTNLGLQSPENAAWVMAILNSAGSPKTIFFDEWHHGIRAAETAVTATNWLQQTPGGRALLYAAAILFIGLILKGRIFGRPVPIQKTNARRAPVEYIVGIANLSRRAGNRTAVLQDYHHRLKRDLSFRYRLNPTLPDAEFVAQLSKFDPTIDPQTLLALLHNLKAAKSEQEMVQAVAAATDYVTQLNGRSD